MRGWIGVDLDGTLAEYHGWEGIEYIGMPVVPMVLRVQEWLRQGIEVRVFTARASDDKAETRAIIQRWCVEHIGRALPVTCVKDFGMVALYDDRCHRVEKNTGRVLTDSPWSLE